MSGAGENFIGFACGMKRSGKSHLLAKMAAQFPRRLILDFIGEYLNGAITGAIETHSLAETADALAEAGKNRRWCVVAAINPTEAVQLLGAIAPLGKASGGFARAVGGLVVECGEADSIAPNNAGIADEVRNIFQRGRHYGVSSLMAVQKASTIHRIVTSQADVICAFRQHEPRDIEYLAKILPPSVAEEVRTLPFRSYVQYYTNFGVAKIIDADGKEIKSISI